MFFVGTLSPDQATFFLIHLTDSFPVKLNLEDFPLQVVILVVVALVVVTLVVVALVV